MPVSAPAQKMIVPGQNVSDPVFSSSFYKPYEAAAQTALLMLDHARTVLHRRTGQNCVHSMTYRLKSPESIREKLLRKGLPASGASAIAALRDIAGLRAVLSDEESVYQYADLLRRSSVARHLATNDYIAFPKESGYRSLHLLLHIPVCLRGQMYTVPAEIQLRTAAMDIWARIEHEICYKPVLRT